jgi:hypothetical protein
MKILMFIAGVFITNISLGTNHPTLKTELTEKLTFDLREVELDPHHQDFVIVCFHICNGKVEISEITGTQKELVQKVKNKLSKIKIDQEYDEGKTYRYKLTFKKV